MEVLQHEAVECELGNTPGNTGTALCIQTLHLRHGRMLSEHLFKHHNEKILKVL